MCDVVEVVVWLVDGNFDVGVVYELGGLEICLFKECLEEMLEIIWCLCFLLLILFLVVLVMGKVM